MKILILPGDYYQVESADRPVEGKSYLLEDATTGSYSQRKAWEALTKEYWKSGCHPKYGGEPLSVFRDKIKMSLGQGFDFYIYADIIAGKAEIIQVKIYEDIPIHIRQDKKLSTVIRGHLKSTTKYTPKQWQNLIDNTIDDGTAAGVNSKKWNEILRGMKEAALLREKEGMK